MTTRRLLVCPAPLLLYAPPPRTSILIPMITLLCCVHIAAAPVAGAGRHDIPAWWREARAFYCPFANSGAGASLLQFPSSEIRGRIESFEALPKTLAEARTLGTDVVYLVDYWQPGYEYKGNYEPYDELGGPAAFHRGIDAIHRAGGRIILYLEAFIISRRSKLGKDVGRDWAMQNADGSYQS